MRHSSIKKILGAINYRKTQMNLLFGLAFRNTARSKYRTCLIIIGVLFTVALETGIVVSVDTLYDEFISDHRNQNYTDITVNPKEWINLATLKDLSKNVQQVPGVAKASPVYYTTVKRFLGEEILSNVLLYGIDSKNHPDFPNLNIITGERKVSGYTIMVSESIQGATGVEIGISIPLSSIDPRLDDTEVTVGGVITNEPYFGNKLFYSLILVDIDILYDIFTEDQKYTLLTGAIDVSVDNFVKINQISNNIKDKVNLDNYIFVEKDISEIEAMGIRAYQTAMNLVILVSLVVEFLFITNILAITIRDRSKEFGILRAVGANSNQLLGIIIVEILFYSIIGCIFGIFGGIILSTFLVHLMDSFYISLEVQAISIHPSSIFATFMSGIIVALISGLYPIFLALSMPIVHNIHSRMSSPRSFNIVRRWKYSIAFGFLLSITGFLLQFFIGPSRFLDFSILSTHFFVIILIFLGTLLVEIGILVFLPKIGMKILICFSTVARTISMRNISREFQKSLFTIITSALALTFIVVTGLTSAAIITSVPDYFENQWGNIDLVAEVRDNNLVSIEFTEELDGRTDIERSSFIQETRTEVGGVNSYILGVDPIKYSHFAESIMVAINVQPSSFFLNETTRSIMNTTTGNTTTGNITYGIISHHLYQRLRPQIPLGSHISVKNTENSTVNITLGAIIQGNVFLNNGEYLYIPSERFQDYFNSSLAKWFVCDVNGDVESVQLALESTFSQFKEVIGITYFSELIEKSLIFQTAIFQVLFIESFILAAMAQFVCILVSTLLMERDMGIMRSIGLHKQRVFEIFMTESSALGLSSLLIGLIGGLLGFFLIVWYISFSIPIKTEILFDRVLIWILISFLVTLASTILPSYRSSQKNIVATISGRPMVRGYVEGQEIQFLFGKKASHPFVEEKILDESSIKDVSGSTTVREILQNNIIQVLSVFLILLTFITLYYILDPYIIIRGLMPSDILLRFFSIMTSGVLYRYEYSFLLINPFLFCIGLAAIGPVSYYFTHGNFPNNLVKVTIRSFLFGLMGIIICFSISFLLFLICAQFFLIIIEEPYFYGSDSIIKSISVVLTILLQLIVFQRTWAFLILQGSNPDLLLKYKLKWTRKMASKGQLGFLLLLLSHILIQAILFIIIQQPQGEFFSFRTFSFDFTFLIISGYEIGFFLLIIIYQLIQLSRFTGGLSKESPNDLSCGMNFDSNKND
ncbi:MAG: FtsX-like permease family protein [Candidatus Hodarchaeales archaeon]